VKFIQAAFPLFKPWSLASSGRYCQDLIQISHTVPDDHRRLESSTAVQKRSNGRFKITAFGNIPSHILSVMWISASKRGFVIITINCRGSRSSL
jgi:hypothetical protein